MQLAEESIYKDDSDPMVNWDGVDLQKGLEKALSGEEIKVVRQLFTQHLCHQNITWSSTIAWLRIKKQ